MMEELKPCPFCGCSMKIESGKYPNGNKRILPSGWHDDRCTLNYVLWCFFAEENGLTEESIAEIWNRRAET